MTAIKAAAAFNNNNNANESQNSVSNGASSDSKKNHQFDIFTCEWIPIDTAMHGTKRSAYEFTKYSNDSTKIAFLQYTSGSTGNPKGNIVTHRNLLQNTLQVCIYTRLSSHTLSCVRHPHICTLYTLLLTHSNT